MFPIIFGSFNLEAFTSSPPECDIRENFDTNECPNIFVSTKLFVTLWFIYLIFLSSNHTSLCKKNCRFYTSDFSPQIILFACKKKCGFPKAIPHDSSLSAPILLHHFSLVLYTTHEKKNLLCLDLEKK